LYYHVSCKATHYDWVLFILQQDKVVLVQIIDLFELRNFRLVLALNVVLAPIRTAEENNYVFPLVTDPAFAALHSCPLCCGVNFEMNVFLVSVVEDQFRVTKLATYNQGLYGV
jgi:hypothetical protein